MTLRAIVVGSGWGGNAARAFQNDDRVVLAAVVGRGSERTRALAEQLGVPMLPSVEAALATVSPHLAAIAVDEEHNEGFARALMAGGCHVLCAHPVARTADAVSALAVLARAHGVVAATDYSLRACAEHRAACAALGDAGALLRLAVEFPGRGLPMAVDLALSFAGPADRVFATRSYPTALRERARSAPAAFAPSVVIEHVGGAVSQLTPVPHARSFEAYRVLLSTEKARIDVRMPAGGATQLTSLRQGRTRERCLRAPGASEDPAAGYRDAITALVHDFIDAALANTAPLAPLDVEVRVRQVWSAIAASLRAEGPASVPRACAG